MLRRMLASQSPLTVRRSEAGELGHELVTIIGYLEQVCDTDRIQE